MVAFEINNRIDNIAIIAIDKMIFFVGCSFIGIIEIKDDWAPSALLVLDMLAGRNRLGTSNSNSRSASCMIVCCCAWNAVRESSAYYIISRPAARLYVPPPNSCLAILSHPIRDY